MKRTGIPGRSVLISGLGRVGKSILAQKLADRYGYQCVRTDDALDYFFRIEDDARRLLFREQFYTTILKIWPNGLVIEGDDFILKNRVTYAKTNHAIDIDPAIHIIDRFGMDLFLLGNADISPEAKIKALERYRSKAECWTTSLRDGHKYALWLIRVSRRLRGLADGKRVHYVEIDSGQFDESIAATADMIAARGMTRVR